MIIRLALILSLLLVAISFVMYFFTRDARYPRFAMQVLRIMVYALLIFAAFYVLERFGLMAWVL